jgi:hypothetical protein
MTIRVRHRNWHAPVLVILAAVIVLFVVISVYLGAQPPSSTAVPTDLPFDLGK